jgi:HEAT repeat protein
MPDLNRSVAHLPSKAAAPYEATTMSNSREASIDHERLVQANLARVFGERDTKRRIAAILELEALSPE